MIVLLAMVSCARKGDDQPPRELSDTVPNQDTGEDVLLLLPQCPRSPCASEIALATVAGEGSGEWLGYSVAYADGVVLAGAPLGYEPHAVTMGLDLVPDQRWEGAPFREQLVGASVAMSRSAVGEPLLAIGQGGGSDYSGAYLLSGTATSGSVSDEAHALVAFEYSQHGGADVDFLRVGADDTEWFVVGATGSVNPVLSGEVVAIPTDSEGFFDVTTVPLRITGEPGFGQHFKTWDPDADGQLDLVTKGEAGVYLFEGPWTGHLSVEDRTGGWDEPAGILVDAGTCIEVVGDVTGDGADDLVFSSPNWGEEPYRTGRAYLVPGGGDLRFGSVTDLPIQFHGILEGEGMGYGVAGADISGDGDADLVLGASGVFPGNVTGSVHVFPGPIADGTYFADDAAGAVHGEYSGDLFGRAIAPVDADGDAAMDLIVGAQSWPAGFGNGKIYLLPGASLLP